jgi:hypothetical protein
VSRFGYRRFPGKTPEGIGIGSTLGEVRKAYGAPDSTHNYGESASRDIYLDRGLTLETGPDGSQVQEIRVWSDENDSHI